MAEPNLETIRLPYSVPYYAQIASPELAESIFVHGMDPAHDPRWAESGADTPQEYAYWVERACGVACLKMCVEAVGGPQRSLVDWARQGLERGGYLIRRNDDGSTREIGWVHSVLAEMAQESGLMAEVRSASIEEIPADLRHGRMIIASVSYEAGDDRLPITKQGGHLMVVIGAECVDGSPRAFYVNNPSGRRTELQSNARLSRERFAAAYSGRVIVLGQARSNEMAIDLFEYDVVLSFANEDRAVADELSTLLRDKDIKVLLDEYRSAQTGGSDFVTHLAELYRTKARYCVMLFSQHYPLKKWTESERNSAQQHALRDANEYLIPVQLDQTEVPGIQAAKGYRDLREQSLENIVDWLEQKLAETRDRSGPPPQSHDLRSGNVPSNQEKP